MRFLCLHGVGSSGSICESQFQPFVKAVDPSYEFVFVDGPFPSPRGPGMPPNLPGPFFSHTTGYSPPQMSLALEHLHDTIETQGPFDGVLAFSQGAALALSYIHQQQINASLTTDTADTSSLSPSFSASSSSSSLSPATLSPSSSTTSLSTTSISDSASSASSTFDSPSPFRVALIFSSVIPCSADEEYCEGIIQSLRAHSTASSNPGGKEATTLAQLRENPDLADADREFCSMLMKTVEPAHENRSLLPDYDMSVYTGIPTTNNDSDTTNPPTIHTPRPLHASFFPPGQKIAIPTIHITGKKDAYFMRNMSAVAYDICDSALARKVEHSGGHAAPGKVGEVRGVVRAMEWAIGVAERGGTGMGGRL